MTARADEERAACRGSVFDPHLTHEEAVAAYLIGHVRNDKVGWACSCGYTGKLGESYERHRAKGIMATLELRGWQPWTG